MSFELLRHQLVHRMALGVKRKALSGPSRKSYGVLMVDDLTLTDFG